MVHPPRSFTINASERLDKLITNCYVSPSLENINDLKDSSIGGDFLGLWDTGATGTVISKNCAKKLDLKPSGMAKVHHVDGESEVNLYAIALILPNQVIFPYLRVTEGILKDCDLLIGMDVISQGDFCITNFEGKTMFSFRIPSIQKIDFVNKARSLQKTISKTKEKIGRNEPCPCGSGNKYKKCCGSSI